MKNVSYPRYFLHVKTDNAHDQDLFWVIDKPGARVRACKISDGFLFSFLNQWEDDFINNYFTNKNMPIVKEVSIEEFVLITGHL